MQALYGKLMKPFFELQTGLRVETHFEREAKVTRGFAVLGLQGLAPYGFELEPSLFVSNKGKVSGRVTANYNLLATHHVILQPRVENEFAVQKDVPFGVEPGISDVEVGLRIRYEVRREIARYLGISYRRSFGATAARVEREGGIANQLQFVVGMRVWR